MSKPKDRANSQRRRVMFANTLLYRFLATAASLRIFARPTVIGREENLPAEGAAILAFNHLSIFDVIAIIGAILRKRKDIAFLATAGLFRWPFGGLLRWLGHIPVRRGTDAAIESTTTASRYIGYATAVALSYQGGIRSMTTVPKNGTARMAQDTGAPVIPAIVVDTDKVKPPGTSILHWRWGKRYVVMFGEPIERPEVEFPDVFNSEGRAIDDLPADQIADLERFWRNRLSDNLYHTGLEMYAEGQRILDRANAGLVA